MPALCECSEPSLELDDVIYAIKNNIDKSKSRSILLPYDTTCSGPLLICMLRLAAAVPTSVVTLEALESALDTLLAVSTENQFEAIQVFNAFEIPQLVFNQNNSAYELQGGSNRHIHADAEARLDLFRNR